MGIRLSRTEGTFNLGVYAKASDSLAIAASGSEPSFLKDLSEALGVETIQITAGGARVVGSLVAINSNGIAISNMAEDEEIAPLKERLPVLRLPDEINAAGNNILVNDHGAIVTPDAEPRTVKKISEIFGVEAVQATIAGCSTVGSVCICTNKGCLCSIDASDDDVALLQDVLKVEVMRTTVNHGAQFVGAGIVANSKGALVGDETTPIEMGRIEDGLVLY